MTDRLDAPPLPTVRLDGVVLLPPGHDARGAIGGVVVTFDDGGVTLASAAHLPRVLPWSSLETYVVEPGGGSEAPWWVDPELRRPEDGAPGQGPDGGRTGASGAVAGKPGALVSLRTAGGTYRLLVPGADSDALGARLHLLAAAHLPPEALPTVTTAAVRAPAVPAPTRWQRVRPVLAVLVAVVAAAAITVILLQSAGVVHLPFLGSTGPTAGPAPPHSATGPVPRSAPSS